MILLFGFLIVAGFLSLPDIDRVGRKPKDTETEQDGR
jgi:hypothetical protein